jgi:hypothetical protein
MAVADDQMAMVFAIRTSVLALLALLGCVALAAAAAPSGDPRSGVTVTVTETTQSSGGSEICERAMRRVRHAWHVADSRPAGQRRHQRPRRAERIAERRARSSCGTGSGAEFTGDWDALAGPGEIPLGELVGYDHALLADPSRVQAVSGPTRRPSFSARFEVRNGDYDTQWSDRSELTATKTLWREGNEIWYSTSILLPSSSPLPPAGGWMLVAQWFAQDIPAGVSGGSPPLAIEVTPAGNFLLDVRGGPKATADELAPRNDGYLLGDAAPDVWHDFLIHAKWSSGSDGLVEAWEREAGGRWTADPQVSAAGPNVLTVAGHVLPTYSEVGIYRPRRLETQVVYNAGMWARRSRVDAERFFPN